MSYISIKTELLKNLSDINKTKSDISFINLKMERYHEDYIFYYDSYSYNSETQDFDDFLSTVDIEYPKNFGKQYLFGCVVFKDNTWLERAEYDGLEWWEYKKVPLITDPVLNTYGDEVVNESY